MSKQSSNLLHIATIGKSVGLKGEMKLHIKSDFPEQFKKGVSFFINENESITLSEVNHERALVKFSGYNSPEDAKKLTNKKLYTTMERTRNECHLEDGEYFWFDIEGCSVVEDGKVLGVVEEVDRISVTNYLYVETDEALVKEGFAKSFLIPFNKPFTINTDIKAKIITVSGAMDILEAS
ncbi:MAG: 16S rRNA processing protein RimM [Sulfurimonas sp. RIFCSPHIGHO2_12_FULL_36_9]|uniref:ribosome maturation factor RimM n=1 Tax=Sulfurimonas sp. RIFCSPLOWO2_12_36_12 TaxID=1802253 RepID=UPI0008B7B3DB|nr:ribosome maturation factor RimM [Sulfurimonas sp. RIFCSPLOWO2_12_36_12]OHD97854.1 MAG: 16S rRNA processing protein RimM [Sulfurimonas sp. RIFCSPLOWO2_02_FULL_36_28]OHD98346.1 MAG: 16S rRNA processing protein RimM [Sulfurimonas sp. RIFCSPHIGHO2_12_FULL_36_9]OHE00962.1 MAG: 16S rRNA processing protein RimM [Sulfurimonas sp. RIFCSPLOWO2_12_36_12]OHE01412.1 MAG: 16S rRNA processing protein RimM [Sulfurimonas sp. RIFCSPLOWO2_12_FULL_36_74]